MSFTGLRSLRGAAARSLRRRVIQWDRGHPNLLAGKKDGWTRYWQALRAARGGGGAAGAGGAVGLRISGGRSRKAVGQVAVKDRPRTLAA